MVGLIFMVQTIISISYHDIVLTKVITEICGIDTMNSDAVRGSDRLWTN